MLPEKTKTRRERLENINKWKDQIADLQREIGMIRSDIQTEISFLVQDSGFSVGSRVYDLDGEAWEIQEIFFRLFDPFTPCAKAAKITKNGKAGTTVKIFPVSQLSRID